MTTPDPWTCATYGRRWPVPSLASECCEEGR